MPTVKKTPARPTSNAVLARRMDDFNERLLALEAVIDTAKSRQLKSAAEKLAKDPKQVEALKALVAMAEQVTA